MKMFMRNTVFAIALVAPPFAVQSAFAQAIDPHQPNNIGSAAASQTVAPGGVAPGLGPGTARLNAHAAASVDARRAGNQAARVRYAKDLAAFDAKMAAQGVAIAKSDAAYASRRHAYADAMAAWRKQVRACKAGHTSACRKPTPQPSDF